MEISQQAHTWHREVFFVGPAGDFVRRFGGVMFCLLLITVVGVTIIILAKNVDDAQNHKQNHAIPLHRLMIHSSW